jgi:hypothetical protein
LKRRHVEGGMSGSQLEFSVVSEEVADVDWFIPFSRELVP